MRTLALFTAGLAIACFAFAGCEPTTDNSSGEGTTETKADDGHGHDHSHDGGHAHGPNGGHPFTFDNGEEYQGEWKHYGDNHIIRLYILDAEGKNVAVKADSVTITRLTGDADEASFTLDAEDPNENGEAVVYSLDSQDLKIAMNLKVKVEMKIGDKTYTAEIAEHQPHDH